MIMDELRQIIAQNISELRKLNNLTQLELADKLHYSDKAVSKWERGESLPEITILKELSDMFNVSVDYLLTKEHKVEEKHIKDNNKRNIRNRSLITCMSIMLVWLIATLLFVNIDIAFEPFHKHWLVFVWSCPTSVIVWLIFNSLWFNKRRNFFIISVLVWTILGSIFLTALPHHVWLIFAIGIPAQIIILLWAGIQPKADKF